MFDADLRLARPTHVPRMIAATAKARRRGRPARTPDVDAVAMMARCALDGIAAIITAEQGGKRRPRR
jgi:hypothetical protein